MRFTFTRIPRSTRPSIGKIFSLSAPLLSLLFASACQSSARSPELKLPDNTSRVGTPYPPLSSGNTPPAAGGSIPQIPLATNGKTGNLPAASPPTPATARASSVPPPQLPPPSLAVAAPTSSGTTQDLESEDNPRSLVPRDEAVELPIPDLATNTGDVPPGLESPHGIDNVERTFALCDGSLYLNEWMSQFDKQWLAANGKNYKKASLQRAALERARSSAFLQLLMPSFGESSFDLPAVVDSTVLSWIRYFQTRGRTHFVTWLRRAEDMMPLIQPELEARGLPRDLVFLAMIESGFNTKAYSIAAAAGPWQFIKSTGKRYGLRINDFVDERRDPVKSTRAAAEYLTDLYTMLGDWHLAAASYNAGEGRILRAQRQVPADSRDFFSLSAMGLLPVETRNYVPKLVAAMLIGHKPERFGFGVVEGSRALSFGTLEVSRSISLADLADSLNIAKEVLENMNPELRLGITPPMAANDGQPYTLRIPTSQVTLAKQALENLPEAAQFTLVTIKTPRRETLKTFASRHGVSLETLLKNNKGLSSKSLLAKGQKVLVPVHLGSGSYDRISSERTYASHSKKQSSVASQRRKSRTLSVALRDTSTETSRGKSKGRKR